MSLVGLGERVRIVAITATVTSAAWLFFGSGVMNAVGGNLAMMRSPSVKPTATATATVPAAQRGNPSPKMVVTPAPVSVPLPPAYKVGSWQIPVVGVKPEQLVDTYDQARSGGRVHDAIDIMAARGTPVVAAVAGTVDKLFTSKLGGLTIYLRSPDRTMMTYYAHLDRYAPGLAEKQQVKQGQTIGFVGFTGDASPTAPHLHFAVMPVAADKGWWQSDKALNPYPILTGKLR